MSLTKPDPHKGHSTLSRLIAATGAVATAAALLIAPSAATAGPDLGSRFTLAMLPDTQFYSRYSSDQFVPRYGVDPFEIQTKWLAENQHELNVPFVAHLGDIVDRAGTNREWEAADKAMSTLEMHSLPYSILPGNHDVLNPAESVVDTDYDLSKEPYLRWFGPERAEKQSTYGGSDPTGLSQYHIFEAEGQEFMVLALTWRASDATLKWANDVIAAHPTIPTILTTHSLLDIEPDGVTPRETAYGLKLWDELIRKNDQIFLTYNGHFHGSTQLQKTNDFGNKVTEVLVDYQMAYEGGNGYLSLLEFDLTHNTISAQTASPWVTFKPQDKLTSYDQAFLDGPTEKFVLNIDFAQRFRGFAPAFSAGPADKPSLSERAREILLKDFVGPDPLPLEQPGSASDFVTVDGTLAHWRFGGTPGVVKEGDSFSDIVGGADLRRVSIAESGSATAELSDVEVRAGTYPFSSDSGAVCFTNSDQRTGRFSYLSTEKSAAINDAQLNRGYTIETFLKIDDSWTGPANSWMKAIVRSGDRSKLPGMPWSQWDYTASPVALGLSSLKEFQWTEVPVETEKGDRTAWSGEIMVDRWLHVALVNDPETSTTTMYVDGAPVLRNTTDTLGHSLNGSMPWVFGADWVDGAARNGWNGCIGETRVIDHPTGPNEWLTARADLNAFSITTAAGDFAPGTPVSSLAGKGQPGATVTLAGDHSASTVVEQDGSWSVPVTETGTQLEPGDYRYTVTQSFGLRHSDPLLHTLSILSEAPTHTAPSQDVPDSGAHNIAPAAADGTLPYTGGSLPFVLLGFGLTMMVLGGSFVVATHLARRKKA